MSNYTIAVDWSGKDALSNSDAAKVISGADFNTEFTTVQTAVNTKANINGSSVESFSATTATAGTNTTQVASTAFVTAAVAAAVAAVDLTTVYPVGSVYMNATSGTNPATLLGMTGTTWVAFGEGRMLLGENASHANGSTGGAETHTLTTAEMPAHTHSYDAHLGTGSSGPVSLADRMPLTTSTTTSTGGGTAHNNMPPYIVVYMWKRTA